MEEAFYLSPGIGFGEGGYSQSEFEEILPIQFEMREKKNLALVIAMIDLIA